MPKILTIIGARPQFIKAATVSRAIRARNELPAAMHRLAEVIVHTGQHYDDNMSKVFFEELAIPRPDYNLEVGSDSHGRQTGKMLAAIEEVLAKENPDLVITYGDTNSTLAGALAAAKSHFPQAHVEAGLRSYNRRMPEEINRIVADQVANLLFCPTQTAVQNLQAEGIPREQTPTTCPLDVNSQQVFLVGDVMLDSLRFNVQLASERSTILAQLGLTQGSYCLVTAHRADNTDRPERLRDITEALREIAAKGRKVVCPLHPRTRHCMDAYGIFSGLPNAARDGLLFIDPVGYLDMLELEKNARVILTDSGGMQKEAYMLRVPCITLREETEWKETVAAGWNTLAGASTRAIAAAVDVAWDCDRASAPFTKMQREARDSSAGDDPPENPYGDGHAAERIVTIIASALSGAE